MFIIDKDLDWLVANLNTNITAFERSLRTSCNKNDDKNYLVIQRINRDCIDIKAKIGKLIELKWLKTHQKFKVESVVSRATFFVSKFEQAIMLWIEFNWDILAKLWQYKKED